MRYADPRRQALHDYLLAVTRDLLTRGILAKQRGDALEDVLKREPRAVLLSAWEDLKDVGRTIGIDVAQGFTEGLFRAIFRP